MLHVHKATLHVSESRRNREFWIVPSVLDGSGEGGSNSEGQEGQEGGSEEGVGGGGEGRAGGGAAWGGASEGEGGAARGWGETRRCPVMTFFDVRAVKESVEDEEK